MAHSSSAGRDRGAGRPARWLIAVARCLRFYSRLPVPRLPFEEDAHAAPDFRTEPRGLPVAALIIALPQALVTVGAHAAGLDALLSALFGVTTAVLATGAFHEDGLADTADGLFGGHDPERRLEIMKDSRIGVFAGVAIALSLALRTALVAAILREGGAAAAGGAILVVAVLSRVEGVRLLAMLPSARAEGAAAAVGRPTAATAAIAMALGLAAAGLVGLAAGLPPSGLLLGAILGHLAVGGLAALARRLIGGQTGDVAGAAQQLAEIAALTGLAVALAP